MSVQLYADVLNGVVTNMVLWDGVAPFTSSDGGTLVLAVGQPNAQIGGTYAGGVFTAPAAPTPPQGIIFENSPVTGATVSLPNAPQPQATLIVYLATAGTLAALTLNAGPAPLDNDQCIVLSNHAVTAFTFAPGSRSSRPQSADCSCCCDGSISALQRAVFDLVQIIGREDGRERLVRDDSRRGDLDLGNCLHLLALRYHNLRHMVRPLRHYRGPVPLAHNSRRQNT